TAYTRSPTYITAGSCENARTVRPCQANGVSVVPVVRRAAIRTRALDMDLSTAAVVVGWLGLVLALDVGASLGQQRALGIATWLLLGLLLWREPTRVRYQVAVVVVFATLVEYTFAGYLGV